MSEKPQDPSQTKSATRRSVKRALLVAGAALASVAVIFAREYVESGMHRADILRRNGHDYP